MRSRFNSRAKSAALRMRACRADVAPRVPRAIRLAALLLGTFLPSACTRSSPNDLALALSRMQASCLVIVLDAGGAAHVGSYGYTRGTTPNLDRLAAEGFLFERVYSQGSSTAISAPSYLTGLYPRSLARWGGEDGRAGALDAGMVATFEAWRRRDPQSPLLLAEAFRARGFRTAGFSENGVMGSTFGFDFGFEHFVEGGGPGEGVTGSEKVARLAREWMSAKHDGRFFAYLHFLRPHGPYTPPEDVARRFRPAGYQGALIPDIRTLAAIEGKRRSLTADDRDFLVSQYDANLFYADQLVGTLLDGLAQEGVLDRTLVVVTADHGEAFGQHGEFGHNSTLYEEMVRVPLIVRFPPRAPVRPGRVATPVALVDLFPTLVSLFFLKAEPPRADGLSLVPLLQDPRAPWERGLIFAERLGSVAAIGREYKYIAHPPAGGGDWREELYNLPADPGEQRDLSEVERDTVQAMRRRVDAFMGGSPGNIGLESAAGSLSEEQRRRLKSLGYLGGPEDEPAAK